MQQQPQEVLAIKAAELAKSNPVAWRDFLAAFAAYTEKHRENLVMSPLDQLPVNQGRAQVLGTLFKELTGCVDTAAKIAQKGTNK